MSEQPGPPAPQDSARESAHPPAQEPAQQRRDPRRNLAAAGFSLVGVWFAWTSWQLESSLALRVPLVVLGVAVLVYGLLQLRPQRR